MAASSKTLTKRGFGAADMRPRVKTVNKNGVSFDAIDICKLIATFFVVGIHCDPLESVSESANYAIFLGLSRFAVPFFFVTTAFFLFRKRVDAKALKNYELRMAKLYAVWYLISFPVTFARKYYPNFVEGGLGYAVKEGVRSFLFASSYRGSWFISGCMFCAAVIYLLSKRLNTKQIMLVCSVPYVFCVLCSTYGELIYDIGLGAQYDAFMDTFAHPYTSIITGLLYFAIGKYFAEHAEKFMNKDARKYALLTTITMLAMLIEALVAEQKDWVVSSDCLFMIIPNVWCLMTLVLCADVHFKYGRIARASGTIVFLAHFSILYIFQLLDKFCGLSIDTFSRYLLILLISFALAGQVLRMENREHLHWMKYMH